MNAHDFVERHYSTTSPCLRGSYQSYVSCLDILVSYLIQHSHLLKDSLDNLESSEQVKARDGL